MPVGNDLDLYERFGKMQGDLAAVIESTKRLENMITVNQGVNVMAHQRHDTAITDLTTKLTTKLAEDGTYSKTRERTYGLLSGSIGGALIAYFLEWFGKH